MALLAFQNDITMPITANLILHQRGQKESLHKSHLPGASCNDTWMCAVQEWHSQDDLNQDSGCQDQVKYSDQNRSSQDEERYGNRTISLAWNWIELNWIDFRGLKQLWTWWTWSSVPDRLVWAFQQLCCHQFQFILRVITGLHCLEELSLRQLSFIERTFIPPSAWSWPAETGKKADRGGSFLLFCSQRWTIKTNGGGGKWRAHRCNQFRHCFWQNACLI